MASIVTNIGIAHLEQLMNNIINDCMSICARSQENSEDTNSIMENVNSIYVNYAQETAINAENSQKIKS